jgi:hypothetical protein
LDLLDAVAWLGLLDARQSLLRATGDPEGISQADEIMTRAADYLFRIGARELGEQVQLLVPRGTAAPISFTTWDSWPAAAWSLRERLSATAERLERLEAQWEQLLAGALAKTRAPDWLREEVLARGLEASQTLPIGLELDGRVSKEIEAHLLRSIETAASGSEEVGRREAMTGVWECWGRVWNEPGCLDSADVDRRTRQVDDLVARAAAALTPADADPGLQGAALLAAAEASRRLEHQLADPFAPWMLLPIEPRSMERVDRFIREAREKLSTADLDELAIRAELELLSGQILAALAVDFADSPRQRSRLIPFAGAWPNVVWTGGPVRPILFGP